MKVKEIIDLQVQGLREAGCEPRYLLLTARALDILCKEEGQEAVRLAAAGPVVAYQELEVVVAELPRWMPVMVSAAVREEMDLYNLRVKK